MASQLKVIEQLILYDSKNCLNLEDAMGRRKDYSQIMDKFTERLDYMTEKHRKVLFFRFDARFPEGYPHNGKNDDFLTLMRETRSDLKDRGIESQDVWTREGDDPPHYHAAVLANGSKIQSAMPELRNISARWKNITSTTKDGLIDHANRDEKKRKVPPETHINRPSSEASGEVLADQHDGFKKAKDEAIYRTDYLSKAYSKGSAPPGVREFGSSEMPGGAKKGPKKAPK